VFTVTSQSIAEADIVQHAIGTKVGNDAVPEFHAQTLPAGASPSDRTFQPNATSEVPGQAMNPNIAKGTWTSASDTIGGATSADVHTGLGHPGSGQTSKELHGDGNYPGKKPKSGLAGQGADPTDTIREHGQDIDFPKGTKGKSNEPGAEDRLPESAEKVAAERK
jgi:hypothetical protein